MGFREGCRIERHGDTLKIEYLTRNQEELISQTNGTTGKAGGES